MTAVAKSYWRSVKRGTRRFHEVPEAVRDDVLALARQDVAAGAISAERYAALIGKPDQTEEGEAENDACQ